MGKEKTETTTTLVVRKPSGKYGKDKANHSGGIIFGKRGAKRNNAVRKLVGKGKEKKKQDRGKFGGAKKEKRRALRAVAVPAELKTGRRRASKKLLIASMLVQHQLEAAGGEGAALATLKSAAADDGNDAMDASA